MYKYCLCGSSCLSFEGVNNNQEVIPADKYAHWVSVDGLYNSMAVYGED
jgi:hypothetical protein